MNDPAAPREPLRPAALAVVVVLLAALYAPALLSMVGRWLAPGDYYAHGLLVPAICGWLLWRDRAGLVPSASSSAAAIGMGLVLLGLWSLAAGRTEGSPPLQQYSCLLSIAGTTLILGGRQLLRRVWFVFAYATAFMVPLPVVLLDFLTSKLKLVATRLAFYLLREAGIPAVMEGATIHFSGGYSAAVDDVCSGLRSVITLLALISLFAYLQRSGRRAALTLLLTVPIALVANVARVLLLCALAAHGSPASPDGALHQLTGISVYLLALVILLAVHTPGGRTGEQTPPTPTPPVPSARRPRLASYVALILLLAGGLAATAGLERATPATTRATASIPHALGPWRGEDPVVPPEIVRLLQNGDYVLRRFRRRDEEPPVELFVHRANAAGTHQVDSCYTLQGFQERERRVATLRLLGEERPASRAVIALGEETQLLYFWYCLGSEHSATFLELRLSSMLRRVLFLDPNSNATTFRLASPVVRGDVGAAEQRIASFCDEALGEVLRRLP